MISNDQILKQIAKQLQLAQLSRDEQSMRETLAAIRALCDVALDSSLVTTPVAAPVPVRLAQVVTTQPSVLREEDANGASLFDF